MSVTVHTAPFPTNESYCSKDDVPGLAEAEIRLWACAQKSVPTWAMYHDPAQCEPVTNEGMAGREIPPEIAMAVAKEIKRMDDEWLETIRTDDLSEVF